MTAMPRRVKNHLGGMPSITWLRQHPRRLSHKRITRIARTMMAAPNKRRWKLVRRWLMRDIDGQIHAPDA